MSAEEIERVEGLKKKVKSSIKRDAESHAWRRNKAISNRRGGKFKLSESQFRSELELAWLAGEFSSTERILRCIELDEELKDRDLIRGELHLYLMDVKAELEKYLGELPFTVDNLLDGPLATVNMKDYFRTPIVETSTN